MKNRSSEVRKNIKKYLSLDLGRKIANIFLHKKRVRTTEGNFFWVQTKNAQMRFILVCLS